MVGPDHLAVGGMATVSNSIFAELKSDSAYECHQLDSGGGTGPLGWLKYPRALLAALLTSADLLHLHVASSGSTWRKLSFAAVARARRRPYIIHLHGAGYRDFLDGLPPLPLKLVRRFFHRAANVIVLGETWRDFLVERLDLDEHRVAVVPNGVRQIRPHQERTQLDDRAYRVIFVGEVGRRKGAATLLAAADRLFRELPGLSIDLLGPLPEKDIAEQARAVAGAYEGFRLRGAMVGNEKERLIAQADVFVLPSLAEGLPMAMLEAMSAGVVPIVTPVGAIPEVIVDHRNGLLIPPGDPNELAAAILELADRGVREPLAANAYTDWQRSYSAAAMTAAVCGVWDEVLLRDVS